MEIPSTCQKWNLKVTFTPYWLSYGLSKHIKPIQRQYCEYYIKHWLKCHNGIQFMRVLFKWVVSIKKYMRNMKTYNLCLIAKDQKEFLRAKDLYPRYVSILGLFVGSLVFEFARTWVSHLHYAFSISGSTMIQ